jgi:hypothetical protein
MSQNVGANSMHAPCSMRVKTTFFFKSLPAITSLAVERVSDLQPLATSPAEGPVVRMPVEVARGVHIFKEGENVAGGGVYLNGGPKHHRPLPYSSGVYSIMHTGLHHCVSGYAVGPILDARGSVSLPWVCRACSRPFSSPQAHWSKRRDEVSASISSTLVHGRHDMDVNEAHRRARRARQPADAPSMFSVRGSLARC